jgi:hypothetical protein
MGIFDWILISAFIGSFIGSCWSLGSAPAREDP